MTASKLITLVSVMLSVLAIAPIDSNALQAKLHAGAMKPTPGARCNGSEAALGSSNVGENGAATTAVNIWAIERPSNHSVIGYVVKSFDGKFWYEPPVPGLSYEEISETSASILGRQTFVFDGCFSTDLPSNLVLNLRPTRKPALITMIVPASYFQPMAERMTCDNSMETGGPIAGGDGIARYIQSIAELRDKQGNAVGWIYLAQDVHGGSAEYAQGNHDMSSQDRAALNLFVTTAPLSSVALLMHAIPTDLDPAKCSASHKS